MERSVHPEENLTLEIVEAVADVTGRPKEELKPFAESIDTDAVSALFARSAGDGVERLDLTYEGCRVSVDPKTITVESMSTDQTVSRISDEQEPARAGTE